MKHRRKLHFLLAATVIAVGIVGSSFLSNSPEVRIEKHFEIGSSGWSSIDFSSKDGHRISITIDLEESGFVWRHRYGKGAVGPEYVDSFVYQILDSEHGMLRVDYKAGTSYYDRKRGFEFGILSRKTWNVWTEYHRKQFLFKIEQQAPLQ